MFTPNIQNLVIENNSNVYNRRIKRQAIYFHIIKYCYFVHIYYYHMKQIMFLFVLLIK